MSTKLFYNQFVNDWMHALPLGNGRIGAMVFGNPDLETIEINEESLWSGRQIKEAYHATPEVLEQIRKLIAEERLQEAAALCTDTFLSDPPRVRFFESFGELLLDFADKSDYTDYRKELELADAVATVQWKKGGTSYQSESFVSAKHDLLVYKISTNGTPFSCKLTMKRGQDAYTAAICDDTLLLNGRVTYFGEQRYGAGDEGMAFGAMLHIDTDGVKTAEHDALTVTDATYLTVYGAFATNYNVKTFDVDESIDYRAALRARMDAIKALSYEQIKKAHVNEHHAWFGNHLLTLEGADYSDIPTNERLRAVKEEGRSDPDLCALYYNFGRYLLIESSGKFATLPANLQGIWAHGFRPAWGADYHTNINLQMNYWPAETCNCSKAVAPLSHFIKMLSIFGKDTARELFFCDGWAVNHTTDIFGRTGVHDLVGCGFFPMAGPWLCLSLWEHYEFTNDEAYLSEIYPILRDSCLFVCDYLTTGKDGYLVTSPSNSPENRFYYTEPDGTRQKSMLTEGATFDFEMIYALFTRTAYACKRLSEDAAFAQKLNDVLEKLPPLRVSERYGTICEWIRDYEETEPGHRHMSHLFGLHPADQINENDPVIFEAAKRTIERRLSHGGGQTGWSRAWIINFFARLKDGDSALDCLYNLFSTNTEANLFDLHPPHIFQIDGNLGATAGVAELLLQSHLGTPNERIVELLPALPAEWKNGAVRGIKARGNLYFDLAWKDGKLTQVTVSGEKGATLRLKLKGEAPTASADCTVKDGILRYRFEDKPLTLHFG